MTKFISGFSLRLLVQRIVLDLVFAIIFSSAYSFYFLKLKKRENNSGNLKIGGPVKFASRQTRDSSCYSPPSIFLDFAREFSLVYQKKKKRE